MKEINVRYQNQGNYQLPCIETKEQKELHIGVWANRHRQYLKQHHRIRYYNLLTSEKLYPYLAGIEEQAEAMFSQLVKSLAEKENVTESCISCKELRTSAAFLPNRDNLNTSTYCTLSFPSDMSLSIVWNSGLPSIFLPDLPSSEYSPAIIKS